jgi:hypothetical protein
VRPGIALGLLGVVMVFVAAAAWLVGGLDGVAEQAGAPRVVRPAEAPEGAGTLRPDALQSVTARVAAPSAPLRLRPQPWRPSDHHLVLARKAGEVRTTTFVAVDRAGRKLAGAEFDVWLLPRTAPPPGNCAGPDLDLAQLCGPPLQVLLADADGEAHITTARGQELAVEARHAEAGRSGVRLPGRLWHQGVAGVVGPTPGPRPLREVLELAPPAQLAVRVLAAGGTPAAGVEVELHVGPTTSSARTAPRPIGPQLTDADGAFEVELDAPAFVSLRARLPGGDELGSWLRLAAGERQELLLAAPGVLSAAGVVVREEGAPVSGAIVQAFAAETFEKLGETRSDADGAFQLSLSRGGAFDVMVHADGLAQARELRARAAAGRAPDGLRLVLRPTITLEGVVLDRLGHPLGWAQVQAAVPKGPWSSESKLRHLLALQRSTVSGQDGSFTLTGIDPAREYQLEAWPKLHGRGKAPVALVSWSPGDPRTVVLRLP